MQRKSKIFTQDYFSSLLQPAITIGFIGILMFPTPQTSLAQPAAPSRTVATGQSEPITPTYLPGDLRLIEELPVPAAVRAQGAARAQEPTAAAVSTSAPGASFATPRLNFAGISYTGSTASNVSGSIGRNHFIQMVSANEGAALAIYSNSGEKLLGPILLASLSTSQGECARSNWYSSYNVLYDQLAERWILAESSGNLLCMYVSTTTDPITGGWFLYEFDIPNYDGRFALSLWSDAYLASSNDYDSAVIYALERDQILAGRAARVQQFDLEKLPGATLQLLLAASLNGQNIPPSGTPAVFMRQRDDEIHGQGLNSQLMNGSGHWHSTELDISHVSGLPGVVLRFAFEAYGGGNGNGFYIDDVRVTGDADALVLSENFETPATDWVTTGLWHRTTACSASSSGHSAQYAYYFGRDAQCNYPEDYNLNAGTLDSPVFDVSQFSDNVKVSFNYFLDSETCCDIARVQLSTDGGLNFTDVVNSSENPVIDPGDPATDILELYELTVDFSSEDTSNLVGPQRLKTSEFDSEICDDHSQCLQQPNKGYNLDANTNTLMPQLHYRNFNTHEMVLGTFITDVDNAQRSAIRWFELRRQSAASWVLHQEGTYSPDTHHRWNASIAINGNGTMALGYNITSATVTPSIRYTGRLRSDPLGQMTSTEQTLINGTGSQTNSSDWTHSSSMSVDPSNDCTFWYTNQYITSLGRWETQIAALAYPGCESQQIFFNGFEPR